MSINKEFRGKGHGYVYILSNPAFKDDIRKIGYTGRDVGVATRAAQLRTSGVPLPFEVDEVFECSRMTKVEKLTHQLLTERRVCNKREFFKVTLEVAKTFVQKARAWTSWAALNKPQKIQQLQVKKIEIQHKWKRLVGELVQFKLRMRGLDTSA